MNNLPLIVKILISVTVCMVIGFLSGTSTVTSIDSWYSTLNKPFFNPPNWIFAPVWTILYIMMGVAFALVWHKGAGLVTQKSALIFFVVQFILNALWSIVFFGMQNPILGLVVIVSLLVLLVITFRKFKAIDQLAGSLLIPYIAWVAFATLLNLSIVMLN